MSDHPETAAVTTFVPSEMVPRDAYRLLVSLVVPRPIAWVCSLSSDGTVNLAPFSFFNVVGDAPPTVMVSVGRKRDGASKDTLRNIEATGEFVVHIAGKALADSVNLTSGEWPPEISELDVAHLDTVPSLYVRPPRLKEAPVALEARLTQLVPVEGSMYTMVLGCIVCYHVRSDLLRPDGLASAVGMEALARLGGDEYTSVESVFSMPRPRL